MASNKKWTAHGCAVYQGETQIATTFIDETGERMPNQGEMMRAEFIAKAVNEHPYLVAIAEAALVVGIGNKEEQHQSWCRLGTALQEYKNSKA